MKRPLKEMSEIDKLRSSKVVHKKLEQIAQECLYIETLETRRMDELDFHDCSVWCLKEALVRAYKLGMDAERKKGAKNG